MSASTRKNLHNPWLFHCSAKKNADLKNGQARVTPISCILPLLLNASLVSAETRELVGPFFPTSMAHGLQTHEWYEKNPNRVTEAEFNHIVREFNKSLREFDGIHFYHNPGRFHRLQKAIKRE
jgi:hypothetical protein